MASPCGYYSGSLEFESPTAVSFLRCILRRYLLLRGPAQRKHPLCEVPPVCRRMRQIGGPEINGPPNHEHDTVGSGGAIARGSAMRASKKMLRAGVEKPNYKRATAADPTSRGDTNAKKTKRDPSTVRTPSSLPRLHKTK